MALNENTVTIGKLEWQAVVSDRTMKCKEAKEYVAQMGAGWRLPTVLELAAFWDVDKSDIPYLDTSAGWFWTSSPSDKSGSWRLHLSSGGVNYSGRNLASRVRCVRDL